MMEGQSLSVKHKSNEAHSM